jgi:hypothetical protein
MIVDFQHHFTPRELFEDDLGQRRVLQYDETTVRDFVNDVRALGKAGEQILRGNVGLLLKDRVPAGAATP